MGTVCCPSSSPDGGEVLGVQAAVPPSMPAKPGLLGEALGLSARVLGNAQRAMVMGCRQRAIHRAWLAPYASLAAARPEALCSVLPYPTRWMVSL